MKRIKEVMKGSMILLGLLISGCSLANNNDSSGGNLKGMNHTMSEITSFSVNGYGGWVGGDTCCISLPAKWHPGLKAHVKWESSSKKLTSTFPGYEDSEKYLAWEREVLKNQVQHKAIVDIPEFDKERCGLTVHFLPCNQVKVTTTCWAYGMPNYPIKEPRNMKEPETCSK
ncbi:DUF3304 domain-containing protein [Xenorhabdus szentirmaii]|uniref:Lipoprotein n=1 Tax=Xenorhabdus szentirmaii DSM 16338 TaxID=1427518 RepID=W1IWW4_9GAMM|nr:DUF3304 domain-containing protein [Xenorhabdus szentirmaii]PHM35229.1 hypothetical protein Xsze_01696 [Xenorhabdus szentirmaii DSM 16338]PHM44030.1 hypothetical protein Xszus_03854 [Xenorhabdus szentirmaii]CDL82111.1 conserved exported hypothetical protein [Xenorhabdus szentirmaii DSM 16338]